MIVKNLKSKLLDRIKKFTLSNSKKGIVLFLIFLLCFTGLINAQPTPPSLRCISVETNGNVTLTWLEPSDTASAFGGYHIFSSPSAGGPFIAADSIFNFNTFTTTITSVNATNNTIYFYIQTREGCCNSYSVSSDTLRSIRMIVTPLSNEHVRLNWNKTHTPPLPSTLSNFVVAKELTPGVYTNFRTTLDTTIIDTNIFCNKFINFRVTQGDLSGCQSVSSIDGELFRDTRGPAQTLIDTVSIDPITGGVYITWFPDSSADTQGYVIYEFNGISYDSIGAVSGINTLSFIHTLTNSSAFVETFSIAAYDSCKNLGQLAANHNTMLLTTSFVKCEAKVNLGWTAYQNMNNDLLRYEIWIRENAGPWFRDGIVPSNTFSYSKALTNQGALYEFVIRAVGGDLQTASSNKKEVIADIFLQPQFLYIKSASVAGSGVSVTCFVDENADTKSYMLYRGDSPNGPFTLVESRNYSPVDELIFNDPFAGADNQRKFYKLTARDSCDQEFVESNIAGTVFLVAEGGNDFISNLSWSEYTGWQNPPGSYHIFRVSNGTRDAFPFVIVSGDTLFFSEDVSGLPGGNGDICYVIMALEDSVNTFGFSDSSYSNIACTPLAPSVFIPNAFTPGGKNPIFKPILLFDDPSTYSFMVFNRWGQIVFSSDQSELGWNGRYNDIDAPTGVYAYQLVFKGLNKKEIRRVGTVTLMR